MSKKKTEQIKIYEQFCEPTGRHEEFIAEPQIDYSFNEPEILEEIKQYIDKTYSQHYADGEYQATEIIIDAGHGMGFTLGNVIKYAKRYGKKKGYNRDDLLKMIHYSILALYTHDQEKGNDEQK